ncbi:MBL fold metallo-hydrolase [Denitrobaculum tricleocarpae]|uniref:MBL fold metallo-hydrolase n=1 Tax=Denitrobaculum tricleocarpae TaxID=2591009 RepID=A0A545TUJ9_9PROT|nr:MBL fold metallo-hydrolase [Denitrobaculum tricleocarpae]TQV80894.1 MBL fold metallo-hydrolase [Denitrobaculum tricleocarpae]
MQPKVKSFFDEATSTATHVVSDPKSGHAAIIDSVKDFDPKSGRTSTTSADQVIAYVKAEGLTVDWILETHVHADHLTAAPYLKQELGGKVGIGSQIQTVQGVFKTVFNAEEKFAVDGRQFDKLFADEEVFLIGGLEAKVLHTPGHTPACATYLIGDAAFVGDTLFMPDFGTARCDFPGGDARALFRSIKKILALPPETRLFLCHDYAPGGREYLWETTVAAERAENIHVHDGVSEDDFVEMRAARDKQLDMPQLILPSVQVNMRAGELPPADDNGVHYLKLPVDAL